MRSAILTGSAAAMALATPAFALPDRYEQGYYEQGYGCTGMGALCMQEQLRLDDGNRFDETGRTATIGGEGSTLDSSGSDATQAAARPAGDGFADDADEAGDEIENTADQVGDEIENAADKAGDAIEDAFD